MYENIQNCISLHEEVRIIYVVDGYEAAISVGDGAKDLFCTEGKTVEEALKNLDNVLQGLDYKTLREIALAR